MKSSEKPLASIGMPVYNGENYIQSAIESILAQTYGNFELIISDNASTDATQDLCRGYANRDKRIRYFHNDVNLGAGPNYDKCFRLSGGKFFKWAAHDDMIAESYLENSVYLLENNPDAVLCFSDVQKIDEYNRTISTCVLDYQDLFSSNPSTRFSSILEHLKFSECIFFGLYRRNVLVGSQLHGNYINSDLILIAEIALRGHFLKINEPLFMHREHGERYTRAVYPDRAGAALWFDAKGNKRKSFRALTLYMNYINIIKKNVSTSRERLSCYRHLLKFIFRKRNLKILLYDLVFLVSPWLYKNSSFIRSGDLKTR